MMIKTGNQICQGGLPATRPTDKGNHLTRFDRKADVVQHLPFSIRIGETQVTDVQPSADNVTLDRTRVYFRLHIQLLEDAFCPGHPFLDGGADFGQLADRLGQQASQRNIGHHVTRRSIATQEQDKEHQHGHRGVDHQLQQRCVNGPGTCHPQLLVGISQAGVKEALLLIDFAAKTAYHAITLDGLGGDMGHIPHCSLDFLALLAKFLACRADHKRDQWQDCHHHQGQAPIHEQQGGKQEDHSHAFSNNDLDRIRRRPRHHGYVKGDTGNQVT
ncbi:hypothetical protein ALQ97_200022 [Pseudomonas savastanoi pv. glycinea]|nr:hypothetical protein ALQ97_200022 [Pseudomonas savastanoi pv. glycinea]